MVKFEIVEVMEVTEVTEVTERSLARQQTQNGVHRVGPVPIHGHVEANHLVVVKIFRWCWKLAAWTRMDQHNYRQDPAKFQD